MPTYEYKCNLCGGTQEVQRAYGDSTEPICCQSTMSRVWSAPAVKFTGTGFYSTGGQMNTIQSWKEIVELHNAELDKDYPEHLWVDSGEMELVGDTPTLDK